MDRNIIPTPPELNVVNGNRSKNFDIFKQKWENFELATEMESKPNKVRVATLLSVVGTEALEIYNTFQWENSEEKTVTKILDKLEKFCKPKKNVTYERFLLLTRKQKHDEKVDDFARDLRTQAESCDLGELKYSIIKDAFVLGIASNKTRENLLKDCNLSLETALNIARASEKAREQSDIIRGNQPESIMKVGRVQRNANKSAREKMISDCKYCGQEHVMRKEYCPALGKACQKCGLKNHFANKCKTQNIKSVEQDCASVNLENSDDDQDDYYVE